MRDTVVTCKFCGFRAYLTAMQHGKLCPSCKIKGTRHIISRYE